MDSTAIYLKSKLNLNNFTLVKITSNKFVAFKCLYKYTKCIYINIFDDYIEIKIDKVFDNKYFFNGIERLLISKKVFDNIDDSINYIQKNLAV